MSRKGENIYKRKDGRWEGRYSKGRKSNGKIQYGYVYAKSYKVTKKKLIEMKYLHKDQNQFKSDYSGDVCQWLNYWLTNEVKNNVKMSTYASYQYKITRYLLPSLGATPLDKIDRQMIQDLISELENQKLSTNTIIVIFSILKQAINSAREANIIRDNPCEGVRLPNKNKMKIRALTLADQRKIEEIAKLDDLGLPTIIALHTGMRIGEIAALEWSNIDFEGETIFVKQTYQRIPLKNEKAKTQLMLCSAKTSNSERTIPLGKTLKKLLLNRKKEFMKDKFVFEKNGRPLEPRVLTYRFKKMMETIDLDRVHFHQLRHTFATRCLEAQENIAVISAILGHNSVKTTLDIYTDALVLQKRKMIEKMEGVINEE